MAAAFKGACRRAREREKTAKTAKSVRKRCPDLPDPQDRTATATAHAGSSLFFAARSLSHRSSHAEWEGAGERTDRCHARRCPDLVSSSGTRTIVSSLRVRALFAGPVIFAGSRFAPAAPRCYDGVVRGQKEVTWQN